MPMSRNKKIGITSVVILVLAGIIGASVWARRTDAPEVQVAKVEKRPLLESKVTANGEVRPVHLINLTSEVAGRVTDIFVKEGDAVTKGKPLLRVDPTQQASATTLQEAALRASQADVQNQTVAISAAENTINNARAALNAAQADWERAKVDRANAEIELKRNTELVEAGINSRSAFDSAKARYDAAVATVNSAESRVKQQEVQVKDAEIRVAQARASLAASQARVAQAQAQLRSQTDLLAKTTQYSPINGVIANLPIQVGTFATANFQSTPLMIIADMSLINVEVRVDETDIKNVQVGQKAKIKVDALGEREIEGEVVEKAASAITRTGQNIVQTQTSGNQEAKDFKVVIRLINMAEEVRTALRPGMSATATVTTDRRESVIAIPLQALVEREQPTDKNAPATHTGEKKERKTQKGVFTVENNKAKFVPVETGITGENDIELKSGLKEGTEIIIGPYRQLRTLKDDTVIKREDKNKKNDTKAEAK
jgi:HlyD family secretion protein